MQNLLMSRELTFKMQNSTLWAGRIMSMLVENFLKTICKLWEFLALNAIKTHLQYDIDIRLDCMQYA